MTIEFPCERCKAPVRTPDSAAGKKGRCPQCGQVVQIPLVSVPLNSAVEFPCPECREPVRTPPEMAGKKGRCPHCRAVVRIPLTSRPLNSPGASSQARSPEARPQAEEPAPFAPVQPRAVGEHLEFSCQGCGRAVRVPRSLAGKKGRCPQCRAIQQIPEVTAPTTKRSRFREHPSGSAPAASGPTPKQAVTNPVKAKPRSSDNPPPAAEASPGAAAGKSSGGDASHRSKSQEQAAENRAASSSRQPATAKPAGEKRHPKSRSTPSSSAPAGGSAPTEVQSAGAAVPKSSAGTPSKTPLPELSHPAERQLKSSAAPGAPSADAASPASSAGAAADFDEDDLLAGVVDPVPHAVPPALVETDSARPEPGGTASSSTTATGPAKRVETAEKQERSQPEVVRLSRAESWVAKPLPPWTQAVQFECPLCGQLVHARSAPRGGLGQCPHCLENISVPSAGGVSWTRVEQPGLKKAGV